MRLTCAVMAVWRRVLVSVAVDEGAEKGEGEERVVLVEEEELSEDEDDEEPPPKKPPRTILWEVVA